MNKKYLLGGFLFWAAVSGYMGMRILDSYTEDAVAAALASIPAQAKEIRFSFFNKTLEIDGLEYDIPDKKVQRKGSIEHIAVRDFNRKILFVMPSTPAYDPESLPKVAETVTVTGMTESSHEEYSKTNARLDLLEIKGWCQRLGLVFDRYARKGIGRDFFEELYRCRMDGVRAEGIDIKVEHTLESGSRHAYIKSVELPGGIVPLHKDGSAAPQRVLVQEASFGAEDAACSFSRCEVSGLLPPDPAMLDSNEKDSGLLPGLLWGYAPFAALEGPSDARPLFEKMELSGLSIKGDRFFGTADCALLSCIMSGGQNRCALDMAAKALRWNQPWPEGWQDIIARYAPGGLKMDMGAQCGFSASECSLTSRCSLDKLGTLESLATLKGGTAEALRKILSGDADADLLKAFAGLRLHAARLSFADSGLAALALEAAAREAGMDAQSYCAALEQRASMLAGDGNGLDDQARRIFKEQLAFPGEVAVELAPGAAPALSQLFLTALIKPARLPFKLSSRPGSRALRDYLP
ncbi:MAG: hypothetical protein J6I40_00615 [Mailhella sp.]|nr:hypothetical protein [Mailhella sp.]